MRSRLLLAQYSALFQALIPGAAPHGPGLLGQTALLKAAAPAAAAGYSLHGSRADSGRPSASLLAAAAASAAAGGTAGRLPGSPLRLGGLADAPAGAVYDAALAAAFAGPSSASSALLLAALSTAPPGAVARSGGDPWPRGWQ